MKREVTTTPDVFLKIVSSIGEGAILVGGQALAYWVGKYDINLNDTSFFGGSISDDTDLLGSKSDVHSIAAATSGKKELVPKERISALVGLVQIAVNQEEYINVDVLHKLYKMDADKVRERAAEVIIGDHTLLVMSPMDIFKSRVENLSGLQEKQNIEGIEQTVIAIRVTNSFIRDLAADNQKSAIKAIEEVVSIARSAAGQRVFSKYSLDFTLAIPAEIIDNESFRKTRWPQIAKLLRQDKSFDAAKSFADKNEYIVNFSDKFRGQYQGEIVYTNRSYALQHIGKNVVVLHRTGTWQDLPSVGHSVTIRYRNGDVDIQPKLQKKDRGKSL